MTTVGTALLRAVCEAPHDDALRLIFADWLDEHGGEARAEFIRVQCELGRLPTVGSACKAAPTPCHRCADCLRHFALRRRERELLAHLCMLFHAALPWRSRCNVTLEADARSALPQCVIRRGFVDEIHCSRQAWHEHGPAIVAGAPVTRLVLTDFSTLPSFGHMVWIKHEWGRRRAAVPLAWFPQYKADMFVSFPGPPDDARRFVETHALAWARERASLPPLQ